ncbi:MAG: hypothetical protein KF871_16500 [Hydrogenophaga sp.]|uniref:hypothetical protein n=1 Tax=Hydrogenophaga sp. TaxID=1904254 RepID=UPI001D38F02D|nr:hypothetical protein [Hydrogenophaga sp.]MBX3611495.1 hypothetical protein [Hydrogenophaga sp.]
MKRWFGHERRPRTSQSEHLRVLAIRRLVASDLDPHRHQLSQRDTRLYQCLTSTSSLETVRHLRFDLFDLLCRRMGEGIAVVRIKEIDAWLSPRH